MKRKSVLEIFVVSVKNGIIYSHTDSSGITTLYDSLKITTVSEQDDDLNQPIPAIQTTPLKTPRVGKNGKIELCKIAYGYYREYILKNKVGYGVITYVHQNVKGPDRKVTYTGALMCDPQDEVAATSIIRKALVDYPNLRVTGL